VIDARTESLGNKLIRELLIYFGYGGEDGSFGRPERHCPKSKSRND